MTIFADSHHSGLSFSLRLLAKRLKSDIFFPIGIEWANEGYWQIHKPYNFNKGTAEQYLSLRDANFVNDHYEIKDLFHQDVYKAITLDQFKEMNIDVVIASIPDHAISFTKLIQDHKLKAKLVFQAGNMFNEIPALIQDGVIRNLLSATIKYPLPHSVNAVFYHEEQPSRPYKVPPIEKKIKSFVHLLPNSELYFQYKNALPEVEFKAYGAGCPDGYMGSLDSLYDGIQDSSLIWNVKPMGDGFGWNWHSAFMLGRPVITNFSDYRDKLGGLLFQDSLNGLDLETSSFNDNIHFIREILNNRGLLLDMSISAYDRFKSIVDYDKEEVEIKKFFSALL